MAYQGFGYAWKRTIEPYTIVKLKLNGNSFRAMDDRTNVEHVVPDGAQVIVLQIIDDEDSLHRFRGLWGDQILSFYMFDSELEVVFG